MPGTGSDGDYVHRAFGPAAASLGLELIALEPASDLVNGYLERLDQLAAAATEPIVVGGVSIGAAVALDWALRWGGDCAGVWAALPAWTGDPMSAPAAWSATLTADTLVADGLEATIAAMAATSPPWLADELGRSWRALHPGLIDHLRQAAGYRSPALTQIAGLGVPLAVTAAVDDPVHPLAVGRDWATVAPHATLTEVTLAEWGHDPSVLGFGCARGWLALR